MMAVRWLLSNLYNYMKYTIDASGKKLGRVASEVAALLMGKSLVTVERNTVADVSVHVKNAAQLSFDKKIVGQTTFLRHTGYPGGLRGTSMEKFVEKKGYGELMRKTVYGMLPMNKLRAKMIKHLVVTD